jgi:putative chitinase
MKTWSYFRKKGKDFAKEYAHKPEKIANLVYGEKPNGIRGGGGNTKEGDGWKYRGRGFNQITFKDNYEIYSKDLKVDLVNDPDLLLNPVIAAKAAVSYFINAFKSKDIDPNNFKNVDDAIKMYTAANAGWDNNKISTELSKAEKYKDKFYTT